MFQGTVDVDHRLERKQCNFTFSKYLEEPEFIEDYIKYRKLTQENAKLNFIIKYQQNPGEAEAETYTDAQLELMLENTYGPLNKTAVRYKQLFESYKRSKFEELKTWKLEAREYKEQNLDPDNLLPGLLCNPDLYDTEEEKNECWSDNIPINPYLLGDDKLLELPFIKIQKNEAILDSLRKFQPKSFTLHPIQSNPKINWLLVNHIRPHELFEEKLFNQESLTSQDEVNCFKKLQDTSFAKLEWMSCSHNTILFPPFYWETYDLDQVERIIWHQIQILLSLKNGVLKIANILEEYFKVFTTTLNPIARHWKGLDIDMDNLEPFVTKMCSTFNNGNIFICSKTIEYRAETKEFIFDKYLIRRMLNNRYDPLIAEIIGDTANVLTPPVSKSPSAVNLSINSNSTSTVTLVPIHESKANQLPTLESDMKNAAISKTEKLVNELQHFPIVGIPFQFIQWGEEPEKVADYIYEDSYFRCLPKWIMNPSQIFMNLYQSWNELEYYQSYIQERAAVFLTDVAMRGVGTPQISLLIPGLYILAYCRAASSDKKEWYRAIIESVELKPFKVMVHLIDFGAFVAIKDVLRLIYMQREILMEFPVQSVECRLSFGDHYDSEIQTWKPEATTYLTELVHDRCLGVNFKTRIENEDSGNNKIWKNKYVWVISINVLVKGTEGFHTTLQSETDVDNPFLQESVTVELDRRASRKRKSRRIITTDQTRFEGHISYIKAHGEYLSKVDQYDISEALRGFMIEPPNATTDNGVDDHENHEHDDY